MDKLAVRPPAEAVLVEDASDKPETLWAYWKGVARQALSEAWASAVGHGAMSLALSAGTFVVATVATALVLGWNEAKVYAIAAGISLVATTSMFGLLSLLKLVSIPQRREAAQNELLAEKESKLAALEARLVPRIEWSFRRIREQAWYHTGPIPDAQGGGTFHYWRFRVSAPNDVALEGVRAFTEGPRFLPWIELEVMGLPGEGAVTITPKGHRYFNLLLEVISANGQSQLQMPYAKAPCALREPPLQGDLHITANNSATVTVPSWIVRDETGRAVPSFEGPLTLMEEQKAEPLVLPHTSADEENPA